MIIEYAARNRLTDENRRFIFEKAQLLATHRRCVQLIEELKALGVDTLEFEEKINRLLKRSKTLTDCKWQKTSSMTRAERLYRESDLARRKSLLHALYKS